MPQEQRPKRLDERVEPSWANLSEILLKYGGLLVGLLLLWLGLITGGFFLLLTGALAAGAVIGGWLLGSFVARQSWYTRRNARPITFFVVVAFPLALIAFAQVAGPFLTPAPVLDRQFGSELGPGQQSTFELSVDPRVVKMEFRVEVNDLHGGAARWFVEDPVGVSRWSGRTDQPGTFPSGMLDPAPGRWLIHLASEAQSASCVVFWLATDAADVALPGE